MSKTQKTSANIWIVRSLAKSSGHLTFLELATEEVKGMNMADLQYEGRMAEKWIADNDHLRGIEPATTSSASSSIEGT